MARGAGGPWKLLDQKKPNVESKQFQYQADGDGEYWFATRTIDAVGNAHPAGEITPQLKVYVDTTKPVIALDADADNQGRIKAALRVDDATPLKKIELRYATDIHKKWHPVEIADDSIDGMIQFDPQHDWKRMSLQVVVTDTPGNQTVMNQVVRRPRVANNSASRFASNEASKPVAAQAMPYRMNGNQPFNAEMVAGPSEAPMLAPLPNGFTPPINPLPNASAWNSLTTSNQQVSNASRYRGTKLNNTKSQYGTPQNVASGRTAASGSNFQQIPENHTQRTIAGSTPPAINDGLKQGIGMGFAPPSIRGDVSVPATSDKMSTVLPPPATPMQIAEGFGLNPPQASSGGTATEFLSSAGESKEKKPKTVAEAMRPITEESAVSRLQQEQIPAPNPQTPAERYRSERASTPDAGSAMKRAPVRFSDSKRFSLSYELEAVGSQGVEAIELYGSLDHGGTWTLWGQDPDRSSPFDIETKGEGVFGFRIVVVGGNGLASPRPLAGEAPDMFVVVDRTRPSIRFTGAKYGEGDRTGGLVMRYECTDTNLPRRPISLAFSGTPDGPWTTIAAGLENTGEYVWRADPNLPRQLYLRIDGTDQAGNVGTYILDQPIDTQGLAPRARIRGFQPLSINPGATANPASTGGQTASRDRDALK